jgi:DDE superfamily endonuclease/Helix-turn-helix of DDE superfamily endonuclease
VLSYPAGMTVSNRALIMLADALRQNRTKLGTRWRKLDPGRHALLVLAHLRKGETYADLAVGFRVGTTTVYRYLIEALELLAAMAPTLAQAIEVARGRAYVTLDGTLLRIDRVAMSGGRDRPYYSGKHKCHGVNVQVIADPAGRLIWASPALPGARHDMGAAREHGIPDALATAGIRAVADTAYQGGGPAVRVPQRRRRRDPDTGRYRPLSQVQKEVNTAHARQRGPGERANAQLKNWRVLRKIRSSPIRATTLVNAVQTLILNS